MYEILTIKFLVESGVGGWDEKLRAINREIQSKYDRNEKYGEDCIGYCYQHDEFDECLEKNKEFLEKNSSFKIVMCARMYFAHKKVYYERSKPDNLFNKEYSTIRMKKIGICDEWMENVKSNKRKRCEE